MDVTETSTAIVALVEANPTLVLVDDKKFEDFYEHVKAEAKAMPIDLSTDKGRKAIASMAHKIARTKTAIDEAGKKLNEEARRQINVVDESRRKIRDRFDTLKDEVRQPLTDWEDAEKARADRVDARRRYLENVHRDLDGKSSAEIKALYGEVSAITMTVEDFGDAAKMLDDVKKIALERIERLYQSAAKAEHDAAELAELRRREAEREEADRLAAEKKAEEEAAAAQAEAQRQQEARAAAEAEKRRKADEERRQAEQERIEREARERAEAEAQQRVEAAERAAREAEAAAARKIDEDRQAREREKAEQERVEREQREADARRQADREHRATIMGAAKAAIIEIGIAEPTAKEIVLAIAAGNVPHVSIKF